MGAQGSRKADAAQLPGRGVRLRSDRLFGRRARAGAEPGADQGHEGCPGQRQEQRVHHGQDCQLHREEHQPGVSQCRRLCEKMPRLSHSAKSLFFPPSRPQSPRGKDLSLGAEGGVV